MKESKFSDAHKAIILKQGADRLPAANICRQAGMPPTKRNETFKEPQKGMKFKRNETAVPRIRLEVARYLASAK